jgi:hypothetical protein
MAHLCGPPVIASTAPKPSIEGRYLGSTSLSTLEGEIKEGFLVLKVFKSNSQSFSCTDKTSGFYGFSGNRLKVDANGSFSGRCTFGSGEGLASGIFPLIAFTPSQGSNLRGFFITLEEDPSDSRHVLRRETQRIAEQGTSGQTQLKAEIELVLADEEKQRQIDVDKREQLNLDLMAAQISQEVRNAQVDERKIEAAKGAAEVRQKIEQRVTAEDTRLAEEKKLAETKRAEEERQKLGQARLAEEKRLADQKRIAEETRLVEERRLAEAKRVADAKRAEEDRVAKDALQREQKLANELREMREQLQALQKNTQTPAFASINSRRLALVIGNDGYQSVSKLLNARADARAMAKQLEATGFKVTLLFDLTERAMKDALRTFRTSVEGGDEVIVFFAGHGVQLGAANYLLPVDIRGDSEEQVKDEAIPLQRVLDDLSERKARFSLAIVDACRDNPFKGSGRAIGGRGLAPAAAASGQMVIFSAGAGQQALDRLGDKDKDPNGLFTRIFLKEMAKPGVPIDRVVRTVRNEVVQMAKSVGHEQVPALYDQTLGDFFFVR